ncbi:MAG: hypothetical protein HY000_19945 [Planctomycetes bacterium]|nr:hypothetical protein [Planctomycetota bacterium]
MQSSTWILAQQAPWQHMGRNFKGEEAKLQLGDVLALAAILGAVISVAWLLTKFLARHDRRRRFNSPGALFISLCQVHELSAVERKLLMHHARQQGLAEPGRLFLEPSRFGSQSGAVGDADAAQLASLGTRLFGEMPGEVDHGVAGAAGAAASAGGAAASGAAGAASDGDLPAS